jgi:hypothetical protein
MKKSNKLTTKQKTETKEDRLTNYPKTDKFKVIDTIGVPHPYCIGSKHVTWVSDHWMGILNKEAIEDAEKNGATCDICRKNYNKDNQEKILSYAEHQQALLIEVNDKRELKDIPDLHKYLLSIKAMAEAEGYVGFAFKQKEG